VYTALIAVLLKELGCNVQDVKILLDVYRSTKNEESVTTK
jgi:hypothetical protein